MWWKDMTQFGSNSVFTIDPDSVIKAQQEPLTLKNLCVDLSKEKSLVKCDFDQDSKKVCIRVKK